MIERGATQSRASYRAVIHSQALCFSPRLPAELAYRRHCRTWRWDSGTRPKLDMSRIHAGYADRATQRVKKDFSHASRRASLTRQRFWAWRCLEPAAWKFSLNFLVPCPVRRSARWAVQEQAALAAATDHKHRERATRAARACSFYPRVTPWNAIATHLDGHRHEQWEDSRPRNWHEIEARSEARLDGPSSWHEKLTPYLAWRWPSTWASTTRDALSPQGCSGANRFSLQKL